MNLHCFFVSPRPSFFSITSIILLLLFLSLVFTFAPYLSIRLITQPNSLSVRLSFYNIRPPQNLWCKQYTYMSTKNKQKSTVSVSSWRASLNRRLDSIITLHKYIVPSVSSSTFFQVPFHIWEIQTRLQLDAMSDEALKEQIQTYGKNEDQYLADLFLSIRSSICF